MSESSDATRLLHRLHEGDAAAAEELLPVVYDELHRMAGGYMKGERIGHTLQATALVNEAYLRLVRDESGFEGRHHFFGVASQAMRRVLVDHARAKQAAKRGGGQRAVTLQSELIGGAGEPTLDALALEEALVALTERDARQGRIVELRFYGGLTNREVAAELEVSETTVEDDWRFARAWLNRELSA